MIKLINVNLVQDREIKPCEILIDKDRIVKMTGIGGLSDVIDAEIIDGQGKYVSHGFIDIHTHGGGGHDYMDATREAYEGAARMHARYGTTELVATSMAASMEEILATLRIYEKVKDQKVGARFLGLHLEGPYLSQNQAGAQDPKYIRDPNPEEYKLIVRECPDILRWTIAPERNGAMEMGDYLREHGVMPSIGHSDAEYETVVEAVKHGFNHVTHLYSGCSTIVRKNSYRFPGIVESAYLLDDLTVEIIADGHHLPASLLQMVYRFIGPDRTTMVTDSLRGAGMPEGPSILGSLQNGQHVIIENGVCKMPDRKAFAGSVATTDRLVRNMMNLAGVPMPVAVDMQTRTAARIIGKADSTGVLLEGRKADLILFDDSIHVSMTMVDGNIIFKE